jgi:hypothetical protein
VPSTAENIEGATSRAAAGPADGFGDAAGVLAGNDLFQTRLGEDLDRLGASLDTDPAAAELVGDRGSGTRADEAVEDDVSGVGRYLDHAA